MNCVFVTKKATERLDWLLDFDRWLPESDTILEASAEPSNDFLWETLTAIVDGRKVRLWLSGGLYPETYSVVVSVRTAQDRWFSLVVRVRIIADADPDTWVSPSFVNEWADRIYNDCKLGF